MDIRVRSIQRKARAGDLDALNKLLQLECREEYGTCTEDDLEASICRDSFFEFVKAFWAEINLVELVLNWHIEEVCNILQEAAERVFRNEPKKHDILINIPPGTTKSTIASIMFPAWTWTRMPHCQIISSSHAYMLAMDLSRKSRDVVLSEKWKRLFGNIKLREDQNSKGYFINTYGGSRYAVGTGGNVMGRHGHIIIVDDPLDPQEALSEVELATANRHVAETLTTRVVDKEVSVMILIMQRLHQNDPSAVMVNNAKEEHGTPVRHINLPGEIVAGQKATEVVRPRRLARYYSDGLLDTKRLSRKALGQLRIKLGAYGYAGQILQTPVPPGGGMFKTDRIKFGDPPALRHFKRLVRYWDKAGTEGGGANTAGVLLGTDAKDRLWILHSRIFQHDSHKREQIIKITAQSDANEAGGLKKIIVGLEQEPGSGGKESAQNTVRNLVGFRVRVTRPTGDKVIRADPFSVQVNGGYVWMKPGAWNYEYIEEMKFFPFSTYKDQIDASSGAFELLTRNVVRVGGMW